MSTQSQQQSNGCGCLLALISLGLIIVTILPSFLSSAGKAKQSEAKTYVGSINRAQQAYFEENKIFSNNIEKLGLGIKTQTQNYTYSTQATDKAVFNYGIANKDNYRTEYILFIPRRVKQPIKSYVGAVFKVPATQVNANAAKDQMTAVAILCESVIATTTKPAQPTYQNGVLACGKGTKDLYK